MVSVSCFWLFFWRHSGYLSKNFWKGVKLSQQSDAGALYSMKWDSFEVMNELPKGPISNQESVMSARRGYISLSDLRKHLEQIKLSHAKQRRSEQEEVDRSVHLLWPQVNPQTWSWADTHDTTQWRREWKLHLKTIQCEWRWTCCGYQYYGCRWIMEVWQAMTGSILTRKELKVYHRTCRCAFLFIQEETAIGPTESFVMH